VEVVCVPFLTGGIWLLVKHRDRQVWQHLLAGLVIGIAFSIRFQASTFIAGAGLALLIHRQWKAALLYGTGVVVSVLALQGVVDFLIWKQPFAEFTEYSRYNLANASNYITLGWYTYFLVVAGLLVPPVSLFLATGFVREWKKSWIIVLPVLLFFVFHSTFPNKQERFIFPVLPFIIMLGSAGWMRFRESSDFWTKRPGLHRASWRFFIVVNGILLIALTFSSSKKNRVDAMRFLSSDRNVNCIVVENSNHPSGVGMPFFYLEKQWPHEYQFMEYHTVEGFREEISQPGKCRPQYVLFMEPENLELRVANFQRIFPGLKHVATIEPSFLDKVMHWLNPVNVNQVTFIYAVAG
jgi:hypothetical protein